ncbi:hypothetical protein [Sphingobium sp. WCS2017Hpa-17]|uniref:hypothetical protein n=1 Tax=Sphingobium sp. WCS2017Hpa-17 TaxID=3073638 RepID=UPI00288AE281|nr:hypothetical protein [Sphingobium sp. WCS2017Hpa-17]
MAQTAVPIGKMMIGLWLCLVMGPSAHACAVFTPQDELASRQYERIVAAKIVSAAYDGPHEPHNEPWSAKAITISVAHGVPKGSLFYLHRTGSHGGGDCDDGEPLPKVGETWILYLDRSGSRYPAYSLPFYKVRKMDPRFGGPPRPKMRTPSPHFKG